MSQPSSRELLFGMIAVSQHFLKPEELIDATAAWAKGEDRQSLSDSLVEQGALTEEQQSLVDSILREKSEGDARDALQSDLGANVFGALRGALQRIDDAAPRDALPMAASSTAPRLTKPVGDEQRFEITKELARGGLGEVFVARDRQLNRDVALKQILSRWVDDADFNERFLMEAEITGRLEHPGVVPVYALGRRSDGCCYYAMRLIRGVSLQAQIDDYFARSAKDDSTRRKLELHQLLRRFIDVCNTIDYAHSRGVIHRDLKPANIMLGKHGETLVVDWGLAKRVDVEERPNSATAESLLAPGSGSGSAATQYGSALGTPHYMSPEQAAGKIDRLGPASDVYSLGATFYHLLTGRPPQSGVAPDRLLEKVERNEFPPPRAARAEVARPLEAICLQAMRSNPDDRYASAGEMAQDIERWLADQRVLAYDEPLLATAARSVRRHQGAAVTAAVSLIVLCIAAVIGSLLWQQAKARQHEQTQALAREQLQREQEAQQRLAERRTSAQANLRFGRSEARAGRYKSALSFFQQGELACADEPQLNHEREALAEHSGQMALLVEFERLSDEAIVAVLLEQDERASWLLRSALQEMGVFDHADWWSHLPVNDLSAREADRIERRVHLQLVLLCSVLSKRSLAPGLVSRRALGLPPKFNEQERQLNAEIHLTIERALSYRMSQWVARLRDSSRYFEGEANEFPPPPAWRADNFCDAFMLGCMCIVNSSAGDGGFAKSFAKRFTGIDDPLEEGHRFLRRASGMAPDDYLTHFMLGWIEFLRGDHDAARSSFAQAIRLRPDVVLARDMRSYSYYQEAMAIEDRDSSQRLRLLNLSLQDADAARNQEPQYEIVYWLRGNALRQLGQGPLVARAYLAALDREPPLESLRLKKWQFLLQGRDPNRVRRVSFLLLNRFDEAQAFARERQDAGDDDPIYPLLEAVAALELKELENAESAARRVLARETQDDELPEDIAALAHAVLGEVHRRRGELAEARDAFSKALKRDGTCTRAARGLAATLEELAADSSDALSAELALAAYEKLDEAATADWQSTLAARGRFRVLLKQGEAAQANLQLDRIWQFERGLDFVEMRRLAKASDAQATLKKLDAIQAGMQFAAAVDDKQKLATLPLRNGQFELGMGAYWEPWRTNRCIAEATIARRSPPDDGQMCLRLEHRSQPSPESRGVLQQILPAAEGRFRVSLWAKGEQVTPRSVAVVIDQQWTKPVIALPGGSFDWRQFRGEFEIPAADAPRSLQFQIVCTGPATVWIDAIQIDRVGE